MSILPGTKAPWFSSVGFQDDKFLDISLSDFSSANQWLVLLFYPLDFGYISSSELLELETKRKELEKMNCKILAVSSDSVVVHEKFASINSGFGGVHGIKFPLLEDKNNSISRMYGVKKMGSGHSAELTSSLTLSRWLGPGWWGTCQSPWGWRRWSGR